jgi:hypothetical protein
MISAGLRVRAGIIETKHNREHGERASAFLRSLGIFDVKIDFERGVGRGAGLISSLEPMSQLCGECWKGKLCVTCSGRAYPCVFARFADLGDAKAGIQFILTSCLGAMPVPMTLTTWPERADIATRTGSNGGIPPHRWGPEAAAKN